METIILTMKELEKLKILERLKDKKIKQIDAAKLLNRSARQIRRLMKEYQAHGECFYFSARICASTMYRTLG